MPYWREGMYDQLLWSIRDSLCNIFSLENKSVNSWTCQHIFCAFIVLKLNQTRIDTFFWLFWLWLIGFVSVYCVGVNERENSKSRGKRFQSNMYLFMGIKVYIVFIQEIRVQIYGYFWVQSLCLLGACLFNHWDALRGPVRLTSSTPLRGVLSKATHATRKN